MTVFAVCRNLVLAHRFLWGSAGSKLDGRRPTFPLPSWTVDIHIDCKICGNKDIATPRCRWCKILPTEHRSCSVGRVQDVLRRESSGGYSLRSGLYRHRTSGAPPGGHKKNGGATGAGAPPLLALSVSEKDQSMPRSFLTSSILALASLMALS